MVKKRVAVLRSRNLLMAGGGTMLEEQKDMEIRGFAVDDADLILQLSAFKPKVVVLDGGDAGLASLHPLGSLLKHFPGMMVIA